nr:signal peptidase II [Cellulomonas persica]
MTSQERRRRRLVGLLVVIAAGVLAVDQLSKAWAIATLDGARRELVGDLLGLQLVFNPGAALSIATGMTWVLTLVAAAVVVVLVRVARRLGSTMWAVALGLLLGGALGNLVDRLVREPGFPSGHVIDFIAYLDWFVGNVADIAIVVAAGLVVLLVARGIGVDGTRERDRAVPPVEDGGARG